MQHSIIIQISDQLEIESNIFNLIRKSYLKNCTANIILTGEKMNVFLLRSEIRLGYLLSSFLVNMVLKFSQCNKNKDYDHMVFLLYSFNMVDCIDCYLKIESLFFHYQDKIHSVIMRQINRQMDGGQIECAEFNSIIPHWKILHLCS